MDRTRRWVSQASVLDVIKAMKDCYAQGYLCLKIYRKVVEVFFFFFPLMSYVYGLCVMFCVSLFLDSSYQGFVFTLISFVYIATTTSLNPDHS